MSVNSFITELTYCVPLSDKRLLGIPYTLTCFHKHSAAVFAVASLVANKFTYRENESTILMMYLLPSLSSGKGPMVSISRRTIGI